MEPGFVSSSGGQVRAAAQWPRIDRNDHWDGQPVFYSLFHLHPPPDAVVLTTFTTPPLLRRDKCISVCIEKYFETIPKCEKLKESSFYKCAVISTTFSKGKQRRLGASCMSEGRCWRLEWCLQAVAESVSVQWAGRNVATVEVQITAAVIMSHYSRSMQHFAAFCM